MTKKISRSKFGLAGSKLGAFFWAGILSLLIFGSIIIWFRIPAPQVEAQLAFPEIDLPVVEDDGAFQVSALEMCELVISYPEKIWIGKPGIFSLLVDAGNISDSINAGQERQPGENYQIMFEARPEILGVEFDPAGILMSPLVPGNDLALKWKMSLQESGRYSGRVWIYLNLIPEEGEAIRQTLFAIPVEFEGKSFLGMPADIVEKVNIAGIAVGVFILLFSLNKQKQ